MYAGFFKRIVDFIIACVVLILTSPIFLLVSLILFIQNRGALFFYQERPGYQEQPFHIIKFKTMTDERDQDGNLLPDVERITAAGQFIRKYSLDELPQLLNVLKGDMSLIGPRPLLFKYIPLYSYEQRRRHEVRPGITGWAQVNGRNSISWTRKFELDIYYVENVSFALDFKIFWLTILKILKREGVNQSDARPMQPFDGSN
ncbi:MAG: lipid carrier--UDP-N-acetylgalactosaminyltransferase [Bacteroidetes bacterium]|jgi:lipopolysaccharide/colanic/teichoic acid biosynthesis glycosyltransferase|nr:lipid carrier--UDP-N-acetylgalactosaminyltransferase [Bacteroidota bacterium]